MKTKCLIIMRGCPGSGKSFLARELAGRTGAKYLSADDLLMAEQNYLWSPELSYASHRICHQLLELAMKKSTKVIIVDNTNLQPSRVKPCIILAKKYGYEIQIKEPETPWRFDLPTLLQKNQHNLPKETLENMLATWKSLPLEKFRELIEHELLSISP